MCMPNRGRPFQHRLAQRQKAGGDGALRRLAVNDHLQRLAEVHQAAVHAKCEILTLLVVI